MNLLLLIDFTSNSTIQNTMSADDEDLLLPRPPSRGLWYLSCADKSLCFIRSTYAHGSNVHSTAYLRPLQIVDRRVFSTWFSSYDHVDDRRPLLSKPNASCYATALLRRLSKRDGGKKTTKKMRKKTCNLVKMLKKTAVDVETGGGYVRSPVQPMDTTPLLAPVYCGEENFKLEFQEEVDPHPRFYWTSEETKTGVTTRLLSRRPPRICTDG